MAGRLYIEGHIGPTARGRSFICGPGPYDRSRTPRSRLRSVDGGLRERPKGRNKTLRKRATWFIAMLMVLSLVAAACADEEEPTPAGGGDEPVEEVDFTACQVTDTGGVDDKSFNQTAFE